MGALISDPLVPCCVDAEVNEAEYNRLRQERDKTLPWTRKGSLAIAKHAPFGRPFLLQKHNQVIFLSAGKDNQHLTVNRLHLSNAKTTKQDVPCSTAIDIENCVYTLHEQQQSLYLIHNNRHLLRIDLKSNALSELGGLRTPTESGSRAHIHVFENKVYVLGGEVDEKTQHASFVYVPYDAFKKLKAAQSQQKSFGSLSVPMTARIKQQNSILIMGGETYQQPDGGNESVLAPHDMCWVLDPSRIADDGSKKWMKRYMCSSMTSFGVINYDNKYVIVFGGFVYRPSKTRGKPGSFGLSDHVYVLNLADLSWYELTRRLDKKGRGFFAVYQESKRLVHLFSYGGTHYVLSMDVILNDIKREEWSSLNLFAEMGKTVLPTRSTSIRNMPPRAGDDDDDDDDGDGDDNPDAKQPANGQKEKPEAE